MKCADCPYLKILYMPLRDNNTIYDFGKAKCMKHNLYINFGYKGKFKKMNCIEEEKGASNENM